MLSNMESYDAILIKQGILQEERLQQLNEMAIQQLEALREINTESIKRLTNK